MHRHLAVALVLKCSKAPAEPIVCSRDRSQPSVSHRQMAWAGPLLLSNHVHLSTVPRGIAIMGALPEAYRRTCIVLRPAHTQHWRLCTWGHLLLLTRSSNWRLGGWPTLLVAAPQPTKQTASGTDPAVSWHWWPRPGCPEVAHPPQAQQRGDRSRGQVTRAWGKRCWCTQWG